MQHEAGIDPDKMPKSRLESLTDGIFAFAMTLLVISIAVPSVPGSEAPTQLPAMLGSLVPQFITYVTAFLILASFWVAHHRIFRMVRVVDESILWLNFLLLLFVVFIPFSTSLSGDYPEVEETVLLFHFNLLLLGLMNCLQWLYLINRPALLEPGLLDAWIIRRGILRSLVVPGVSLVAIGMTFVVPTHSTWTYVLIMPILLIVNHLYKPPKASLVEHKPL